jgi:hypothetical protein
MREKDEEEFAKAEDTNMSVSRTVHVLKEETVVILCWLRRYPIL